MGGLARRATYLRRVRSEAVGSLLIDTGGTLKGGADGPGAQTDELVVRALEAMGYDALNLGAGEARAGPLALRRLALRGAPALVGSAGPLPEPGAGAAPDAPPGPHVSRYVVREVAGVRVGLVGVAEPEPTGGAAASSVASAVEALRRIVPEVRRQADLVVTLADLEPDAVEALARAGPDLDVVLGGRSVASRPAARLGRAVVAAAGGDGGYVGRLRLEVDSRGRVVSFAGEDVFLDDGVPEDPDILALRAEYQLGGP